MLTPDETDALVKFYGAVGSLFINWGILEGEMAAALREQLTSQMRNGSKGIVLACSIYGSMRMKTSRDTMKRIAEEFGYGAKALAFHKEFFQHIGHIEDFRDKLAHQAVMRANKVFDNHWRVSDFTTTRTIKSIKIYEFETDAIFDAAEDLRDAAASISLFLKKGARRSAPQLPTWRYKPSMLKLQRRRSGPSPQLPPSLPEASQGSR
jgi:hypothetical protein